MSNRVIWQSRSTRIVEVSALNNVYYSEPKYFIEQIEENTMGESYWQTKEEIGTADKTLKGCLLFCLVSDIARGKSRNEKENDHEAMGKEQHG